jgi:hypothetical protein
MNLNKFLHWTVIILGSFALLLNDIVKHQWIGAFAGEITFILIFVLPEYLIRRHQRRKVCKYLYADWCHKEIPGSYDMQEKCGFYHCNFDCPEFEEVKK